MDINQRETNSGATEELSLSANKNGGRKLVSALIWIVVAVVLALGAFFFTNNYLMRWPIKGPSMTPTLLSGDDVLLFRTQKVGYDDVIIFYHEDTDQHLIKRVVGKEGDVISSVFDAENNVYHVYRNGELLSEEKINEPMVGTGGWKNFDFTVPKGKVYVLGDNRNNSYDSNDGVLADESDIVGIAFLRIRGNSVSILN